MLEINPGLLIWTIVTFILLAGLLAKFGWKPILKMLGEREDKIRNSLDEAEKARTEAAELIKQNEKNLAHAEEEYKKLIRQGRDTAEKMKEEIVARAKQQAQLELQQATAEIQRNLEAAKAQLRSEVADLAIKATEKMLEETLDDKKQKKLADSIINQLSKN